MNVAWSPSEQAAVLHAQQRLIDQQEKEINQLKKSLMNHKRTLLSHLNELGATEELGISMQREKQILEEEIELLSALGITELPERPTRPIQYHSSAFFPAHVVDETQDEQASLLGGRHHVAMRDGLESASTSSFSVSNSNLLRSQDKHCGDDTIHDEAGAGRTKQLGSLMDNSEAVKSSTPSTNSKKKNNQNREGHNSKQPNHHRSYCRLALQQVPTAVVPSIPIIRFEKKECKVPEYDCIAEKSSKLSLCREHGLTNSKNNTFDVVDSLVLGEKESRGKGRRRHMLTPCLGEKATNCAVSPLGYLEDQKILVAPKRRKTSSSSWAGASSEEGAEE